MKNSIIYDIQGEKSLPPYYIENNKRAFFVIILGVYNAKIFCDRTCDSLFKRKD